MEGNLCCIAAGAEADPSAGREGGAGVDALAGSEAGAAVMAGEFGSSSVETELFSLNKTETER